MKEIDEKEFRPARFLESQPYKYSRQFAEEHDCDLAVPNGVGIGNVVCFTRLVEEMARREGRPLRVLTAPLKPIVGTVDKEAEYPIWENNPFIERIINADEIHPEIMEKVVLEQDNYCQFSHIIENLCAPYGIRPNKIHGSLFLSCEEMQWALEALSHLKRPLLCIHPAGTSSSMPDSHWYREGWRELLEEISSQFGIVQLDKHDYDHKDFGVFSPNTTLRQAFAIIWASDFFLGFDSGLGHVAASFEKSSIILWDAVRKSALEEFKEAGFASATMLRWAYPWNRNLLILGEKDKEIFKLCVEHLKEYRLSLYRQ